MTRQRRLVVWIVVVVAVLASPVWFVVGGARIQATGIVGVWAIAAAAIWQSGWLTVMARLLATTPGDAIKLPWWLSAAVLVAGMVQFGTVPWWLAPQPAWPLIIFGSVILGMYTITASLGIGESTKNIWGLAIMVWSPCWWLSFTLIGELSSHRRISWLLVFLCIALFVVMRRTIIVQQNGNNDSVVSSMTGHSKSAE